jgi:hypothetical protein
MDEHPKGLERAGRVRDPRTSERTVSDCFDEQAQAEAPSRSHDQERVKVVEASLHGQRPSATQVNAYVACAVDEPLPQLWPSTHSLLKREVLGGARSIAAAPTAPYSQILAFFDDRHADDALGPAWQKSSCLALGRTRSEVLRICASPAAPAPPRSAIKYRACVSEPWRSCAHAERHALDGAEPFLSQHRADRSRTTAGTQVGADSNPAHGV